MNPDSRNSQQLRQQAEQALQQRTARFSGLSPEELRHELNTYFIELEMQNQQLRETEARLQQSIEQYQHLYHKAPIGYLTLDSKGTIQDLNETFVTLTRMDPAKLRQSYFAQLLTNDSAAIFRQRLPAFFNNPVDKVISVWLEGERDTPVFLELRAERLSYGNLLACNLIDRTEKEQAYAELDRTRKLYSSLFEYMGDCVAIYRAVDDGEDFILVDLNSAAEEHDRIKRQSVIGERLSRIDPDNHSAKLIEVMRTVHDTGSPRKHADIEKEGNRIQLWRDYQIYQLPSAEIVTICRDLTREKQLEAELITSAERFMSLFNNSPIPYQSLTDQGEIIDVNPAWLEVLGYQARTILGRNFSDLLLPQSKKTFNDNLERLKQGERFNTLEYQIYHQDGRVLDILCGCKLVYNEDAETCTVYLAFEDISLRKETERKYTTLIDEARVGIVLADTTDGTIVECNQYMADLVERSREELIGRRQSIFHPPDHQRADGRTHNFINQSQQLQKLPVRQQCLSKSGRLIDVEIAAKKINYQGRPMLLGIFHDITERLKADQLREQYLRELQTIGAELPGVVYKLVLEPDGRYHCPYISDSAREIYGIKAEDVYRDVSAFFSLVHPEDLPGLMQSIEVSARDLSHWEERFRVRGPDSSVCWLFGQSTPVKEQERIIWYGFLMDISAHVAEESKRRELERQLHQKHKMEAIGVMAGGIAHNFNNNLAIILGNLELLELKSTPSREGKTFLNNAKTALRRSSELIRQIMIYSRNDYPDMLPIELAPIVRETCNLLRSTVPSSVNFSLQIKPATEKLVIKANATNIQEALINLSNNSVQAMDGKGTLTIELDNRELADDISARPAGSYAVITVLDNGSGIPEELHQVIFDPFFTTKAVGIGTGMGLSTVRSIVDNHGGFVRVNSRVGAGTSFSLYFPVDEKPGKSEFNNRRLFQGTGNILFVDDEPSLVTSGQLQLTALGYEVIGLTKPRQALDLVKENPRRFDLVITDQTMPEMLGSELAPALKKINPELPIILTTGYSQQISSHSPEQLGVNAVCAKPLSLSELSRVIRECLRQLE